MHEGDTQRLFAAETYNQDLANEKKQDEERNELFRVQSVGRNQQAGNAKAKRGDQKAEQSARGLVMRWLNGSFQTVNSVSCLCAWHPGSSFYLPVIKLFIASAFCNSSTLPDMFSAPFLPFLAPDLTHLGSSYHNTKEVQHQQLRRT